MAFLLSGAAEAVIRPPRSYYNYESLPSTYVIPNFGEVARESIKFTSHRQHSLVGSFFFSKKRGTSGPCVIYIHTNSGNHTEAGFLIPLLIPIGINLFSYDAEGCGCSEGSSVSLGFFESFDLEAAVSALESKYVITKVCLYGRSMGAATAILYLSRYKALGAVCDSSFASLSELCVETAIPRLPSFMIDWALKSLKEEVKEKGGFSVDDVSPISAIGSVSVPIFFIHGKDDKFVIPTHTLRLHDQLANKNKKLMIIGGDHTSIREEGVILAAVEFLADLLGIHVEFDRCGHPPTTFSLNDGDEIQL